MKITQIEAFQSVIRAGSISEAARQLHLTQPALSLQIRDLEAYFNVQLLERSNRGVKPTSAGRLVYQYGDKIMKTKQALWQKIEQLQNGADLQIAVGVSSGAIRYIIPSCVSHFQEENPAVQIHLTVANSSKIRERLLDGHLDIIVTDGFGAERKKEASPNIMSHMLGIDELVLVGSPATIKQQKEMISIDKFYHIPLIMREKGSGLRSCTEEALLASNLNIGALRILMEVNCIESIKILLRVNNNFAFLARKSVQKEIDSGILQILYIEKFSGKIPISINYLDPMFLSPLQKKFIACIRLHNPFKKKMTYVTAISMGKSSQEAW